LQRTRLLALAAVTFAELAVTDISHIALIGHQHPATAPAIIARTSRA
jgi:hypothetical protein